MSELLYKGTLKGPLRTQTTGADAPWAGLTTLDSGSATVTVSTASVQSDSIVQFSTKVGTVGVGANSGANVVVASVVDAVSFAFARATGVAVPWDETMMWTLTRTSYTN